MKDNLFDGVGEEWNDYFETGKDKINKEKFEREKYDFSDLLNCYEKWREEAINQGVLDAYQIAAKFLKEYEIPFLSEKEINELIEEVEEKEYSYKGIFFSAMINELYKNKEIHISSDKINYLGCCFRNKKIVIEGDCENWTGVYMKSGEIVIEGDCEGWTGEYMTGGEIIVKGNCENGLGDTMKGGKIKIYGDNFDPKKQISIFAKKGEIYHKDELVWKDGELI
ncbi:MAG: hypothetical protein KAU95_00955 [Candidatus Aenigmarchaeota archaeon]|nr:hypothetical protein [Candidatus Aenigmarchaeota archaeon]